MKARSIGVAALLFLMSAAFTTTAQELPNPVIRLLPASKQCAVKLLVAEHDNSTVEVRFYSAEGLIANDEIDGSRISNGFLKSYNFQKLHEKAFWMSVRTNTTSVVYKITRSGDSVEARLEEATYTYPVVAAR